MIRVLVVAGLFADEHKFVDDLRSCGYQVEHRQIGGDALAITRHAEFDLIAVSLSLAGQGGAELIQTLRAIPVRVPVVALSAAGQTGTWIEALAVGATEVIELPLDQQDLRLRLRALLPRDRASTRKVLSAGAVSLDLETHAVVVNGTPLDLSAKEAAVLELLMLRRDIPLSRESLLTHLHAVTGQEADARIVDVLVGRLHSKLVRAGASDLIETVWGRGYMVRGTSIGRGAGGHPTDASPLSAPAF